MKLIDTLIDKKDSFEIVRDQIAAILKLEIENQKLLASAANKNPKNWDLRIFQERSRPFEQFQDQTPDLTPIVNVWYDSTSFDEAGSDTIERQKAIALYNIDCYTAAGSTETAEGHLPGDLASALDIHKVIRLVRNILMTDSDAYLQLRGLVWNRRIDSINVFQPDPNDSAVQNIMGARIVFRVTFNETSPQVTPTILDILGVTVKRAETGEILFNAEYHYNGD